MARRLQGGICPDRQTGGVAAQLMPRYPRPLTRMILMTACRRRKTPVWAAEQPLNGLRWLVFLYPATRPGCNSGHTFPLPLFGVYVYPG